MQLSIIIVTYRVRKFIAYCLNSIFACDMPTTDYEVIVVDNNSTDYSADFIAAHFPQVILLKESTNHGFAKACNMGSTIARGQYLLFLNPDCIVLRNSFSVALSVFANRKNITCIGGQLLDGKLQFLPESRRKFPDLLSAVLRLTRLDQVGFLKPYSYYQDDISEDNIEVLSGAYFFIVKSRYSQIGGFDESYFLYGEDIDLSKRIPTNEKIYAPDSSVIHFKGESGSKGWTYYQHFYRSLLIYIAQNWWGLSTQSKALQVLSKVGSGFGIFRLIVDYGVKLMMTIALACFIYLTTTFLWAKLYYQDWNYFPSVAIWVVMSVFASSQLLSQWWFGAYHGQVKTNALQYIKASIWGGIIAVVIYALLPSEYRFSRVVLLSSVLIMIMLLTFLNRSRSSSSKKALWVPPLLQHKALHSLCTQLHIETTSDLTLASHIVLDPSHDSFTEALELAQKYSINIAYYDPIDNALLYSNSSSRLSLRESHMDKYRLYHTVNRMQKRCFDVGLAIIFLLLSPIGILVTRDYIKIVFSILEGRNTWIGYHHNDNNDSLPHLRPSILTTHVLYPNDPDRDTKYALHYTVWNDIYGSIFGIKKILRYFRLYEK